jgi:micrococcal nuclease
MSKKALAAIMAVVALILNQFLAKYISPSVQVPETLVDEVADYILPKEADTSFEYKVNRVVDGDTIEVDIDGKLWKVRYIGVDTPETIHSGQPVGCFSDESTLRNKQLVEGQRVKLVKDFSETDKYGRLLRYVYVNDVFVNMKLVEDGFAKVTTYPPDIGHSQDFLAAEKIAKEEEVGLWGEVCNEK